MKKGRLTGLVCLATVVALALAAMPALATQTLEKTQEWKGIGDTVANAVFAADVDADSTVEILTVGSMAGVGGIVQAQLRIWTWTGTSLNLEKNHAFTLGDDTSSFPTEYALDVFAGDLDGGVDIEIVTVGYAIDTSGNPHDHLAIWSWDGSTLTRHIDLGRASPATMRGVWGHDFDGNYMEIVTVGEDGSDGRIFVWNWDGGNSITGVDDLTWSGTNIVARSVHIENIKGTSAKEIITAGNIDVSGAKWGQTRVYDFSGGSLSLADDAQWRFGSSHTEAFSVFAGAFDGSNADVGVCGSYDNSGNPKAGVQFLRWNSGGGTLDETYEKTWLPGGVTATQCRALYAADMTGATGLEIVAGGYALISGTEYGEVRTFNYDGSGGYSNEDSTAWVTTDDTRVHGTFAANVDGDGTVEFLSVGQAKDGHGVLNAQLRIWHL